MGSFPTSWTTGDVPTAADFNTLSGAWDSYTPTIGGTGWALGNGTITGLWKKVGRVNFVRFGVTWGTTSTFGAGQLTISLPNTVNASTHCIVEAVDAGGPSFFPLVAFCSGTTAAMFAMLASGTYVSQSSVTSTIPFTWVNTDVIRGLVIYESTT